MEWAFLAWAPLDTCPAAGVHRKSSQMRRLDTLDTLDTFFDEVAQNTMTTAADKTFDACIELFKTWLASSAACAEASREYAAQGTKENRQSLSAAARALAEAGRALAEARMRFRATVEPEKAAACSKPEHQPI